MKKKNLKELKFNTLAVHAGQDPDPTTGAVMTPIYQSSTFMQESPGKNRGYEYSRSKNPTRQAYEDCVAALEGAEYGLAYSSGMAAIDSVLHLLKTGDHIICCDDVYGGTFRILDKIYKPLGLQVSFIDFSDPQKVKDTITDQTKVLWFESPTNPLLKIFDVQAIADIAKQKNLISVVDNTFMSPYFQNPIQLGVDIVVHSVTKYMNGHSDVIGGVVITNKQDLYDRLKFNQNAVGSVPSPMDCFLVMRGIKTLPLRMERHQENAKDIAAYLESHSKVQKVIYPGLESHPQHNLAKNQMSGFGGMITFYLKGGLQESRRFLENVSLFTLAESLGGVESLIEHPAIMTHASIPAEIRQEIGVTDNLVRMSVGIEALADLKADLDQALDSI